MAVTWSVGASPLAAALVVYFLTSIPFGACGVCWTLACAGIPLALHVPLGLWYVCLWGRWCALRGRVVPSFRLRAGVPHTMLLSVRAAQRIESIKSICGRLGGGVVLVAVVCSVAGTSPCLYLVVLAAALTACACMGIPRGRLAPAGTLACVSWCGVPFPVFPCGALRLGGLFPLMLSHTLTLLVSWRPLPMRAGDVSGPALLLVVVQPLCPFPRALRTSARFRRVEAWRIV